MNGVNYLQLLINRPLVSVHNNQRDGYQSHNIYKGKVAYYHNTLQNGAPAIVSKKNGGYLEYAEPLHAVKQRGKSAKFLIIIHMFSSITIP
jgi:catalase